MMVGSDHATFQQRPKGIDVGGVNVAAHVFALAVIHGFVIETILQQTIAGMLIGRDQRHLIADGLAHKPVKCFGLGIFDHPANNVALTSNRADNGDFASRATPEFLALGDRLIAFLAAHVCLVNFNGAAIPTEHLRNVAVLHCGPDAMAHIPSRPVVARPDLPVDLKRGHALLALCHQIDDFKPSPERVVCVLKNRVSYDREPITVFTAAIGILANPVIRTRFQGIDFLTGTATRAFHALRPAQFFEIFLAGIFGRKLRLELMKRHTGLGAKDFCFHDQGV